MTEPAPTWEERDLPVLRAILHLVEQTGDVFTTPGQIAHASGFDDSTVQKSLNALEYTTSPFLVGTKRMANGDAFIVGAPTELARRAVGLWPTPDDLADRFIAAYDAAIAEAYTEERRGALRKIRELTAETGRGVLVEVMGKILTGS